MSGAVVKVCVGCGKDVANEKRVKDPQGRYYCAGCFEAMKARKAVAVPAGVAGNEGELDFAPRAEEPVQRAAKVAHVPVPGRATGRAVTVAAGGPPCPCCGKEVGLGGKICVGCGIQVPSGRPVITSLGRDENQLYANAEQIIQVIAWIIRFGFYPIASEAYAIRKPIVIWVMAALMSVSSIAYFVALRSNPESPALMQLMLWPEAKPMPDEAIVALYHEHKGDKVGQVMKMWAQETEPPRANATLEERVVKAFREQKADEAEGSFRWYQLITNTFLHDPGSIFGLIMHLGGNLLFLLIFGTRVNALVGNVKMMVIYPVLAVLASGAHLLFTHNSLPTPALGASGVIMGLAGMYLIFFPVHRVYMAVWLKVMWRLPTWIKIWPTRGFWVLGFYIAFDVVATLLRAEDGVAHWAHLGGFIAGMGIGVLMLVCRVQEAQGNLLSVLLGKAAWPLVGKPQPIVRGVVVG